MASQDSPTVPPGYSFAATAILFALGGLVTAVFSGSLVNLAANADWREVFYNGMIVPCFTWVVQMFASAMLMTGSKRVLYWGDLGRICLLGSIALLPAGIVNLCAPGAPLWLGCSKVGLDRVFAFGLSGGELLQLSRKKWISHERNSHEGGFD